MRGAFQSCGQNCAGAERFLVHSAVYDRSESPRHPPVSLPITQRADLLSTSPGHLLQSPVIEQSSSIPANRLQSLQCRLYLSTSSSSEPMRRQGFSRVSSVQVCEQRSGGGEAAAAGARAWRQAGGLRGHVHAGASSEGCRAGRRGCAEGSAGKGMPSPSQVSWLMQATAICPGLPNCAYTTQHPNTCAG